MGHQKFKEKKEEEKKKKKKKKKKSKHGAQGTTEIWKGEKKKR